MYIKVHANQYLKFSFNFFIDLRKMINDKFLKIFLIEINSIIIISHNFAFDHLGNHLADIN